MEERYKVIKHNWGFCSCHTEEFTGTIFGLSERFKYELKGKKVRTLNGLKKGLNNYAKSNSSTYTGVSYEVFRC